MQSGGGIVAAWAMASATDANPARNCRFLMVGGIIVNSPAACRSSASAGRVQKLAMVSLSSCTDVCSGGAGAK